MKKYVFYILIYCFSFLNVNAQVKLSVFSEISIVTAGPGDELYEAFGHSAIRIKDPVLQLDLVYNYGMFDFNAPNFYTNFTKGKLLYKLGRYDFKYFLASYLRDQRWVTAQILDLNQEDKQAFFMFLEQNASPENAQYYYDPFYNNCATKLRDISKSILGNRLVFHTENTESNLSLRTLMNRRIHWNTWGGFGINLALGSLLDKEVNPKDYMYLPDYVYELFLNAELDGKPLIKKEEKLLSFDTLQYKNGFFSPLLLFSILTILGIWITYRDYQMEQRTKSVDFIIFFSTGLIGMVLTFLWFFTDHSTTPYNYNLLWAFAPNIIVAFLLLKEKYPTWIIKYVQLLIVLLFLVPFLWLFSIQTFPLAIIPLLFLVFFRYVFLVKYLN